MVPWKKPEFWIARIPLFLFPRPESLVLAFFAAKLASLRTSRDLSSIFFFALCCDSLNYHASELPLTLGPLRNRSWTSSLFFPLSEALLSASQRQLCEVIRTNGVSFLLEGIQSEAASLLLLRAKSTAFSFLTVFSGGGRLFVVKAESCPASNSSFGVAFPSSLPGLHELPTSLFPLFCLRASMHRCERAPLPTTRPVASCAPQLLVLRVPFPLQSGPLPSFEDPFFSILRHLPLGVVPVLDPMNNFLYSRKFFLCRPTWSSFNEWVLVFFFFFFFSLFFFFCWGFWFFFFLGFLFGGGGGFFCGGVILMRSAWSVRCEKFCLSPAFCFRRVRFSQTSGGVSGGTDSPPSQVAALPLCSASFTPPPFFSSWATA